MKKRLVHFVLLSCSRATFLIEKKPHVPLHFLSSAQLRLHLAICDGCKKYEQQSTRIDSLLKSLHEASALRLQSTEAFKDRLIATLKNK